MQKSLVRAPGKRNRFEPEEAKAQEPADDAKAAKVSLVAQEVAELHDKEIIACLLASD
jgi:hypothetical protein